MQRRALLRSGVALGTGAGLLGRVSAHPTPNGGADESPTGGDPTPTPADGYRPLGRVGISGATEAVVSADGHIVYVAATTGYAVVDVTDSRNPEVVAERRDLLPGRDNGPLPQIYDVKQDGDTLLVVGPANGQREPTLMGMLVVDVADPFDPRRRAFYETDYPIHNCYLDGDTAYLTANGESMRLEIVDVGGDEPTRLSSWSLEDEDDRWNEVARGMRVVHDVFVQDDVAYVAHWDAGTWLLDVSDPSAPSVVSHVADWSLDDLVSKSADGAGSEPLTLPGNSHYVAVDEAGDLMAVGREAWAVDDGGGDDGTGGGDDEGGDAAASDTDRNGIGGDGGPGGIDLFDVSDPTAPEMLSTIDPPESPDPTLRGTWTTSHNFEFRDGVLYSSWYRGGVKRHDVSDPTAPEELTWWADANEAEFWTARVAAPGETFVASSRGTARSRAGLFVFPDAEGETVRGLGAADATETPTASPTRKQSAAATTPSATQRSDPAVTTTTTTDSPGFGLLTGLAALGLGALGLRRRRTDE